MRRVLDRKREGKWERKCEGEEENFKWYGSGDNVREVVTKVGREVQ